MPSTAGVTEITSGSKESVNIPLVPMWTRTFKEEEARQTISRDTYKMTNDDCIFDGYEEWDEDEDMKWILTFRILDEFELKPDLN